VSRKTDPLVLDAFPLLGLFGRQRGWEVSKEYLDLPLHTGIPHLLSSINFGEVLYVLQRDHGERAAETARQRILEGTIEIVLPTLDQTYLAARLKSNGGASYADCYAAALALERDLAVLTGDMEFKKLEPHGVRVEWLPANREPA
jgi:predicted nucleic acid-binding protein